jgi:hypothetical protein
MVVGFASYMTKADVTGSFNMKIIISPIPCETIGGTAALYSNTSFPDTIFTPNRCEDTLQKSDFETLLNVNWTISGLTLGFNVVAGFTGLEHVLTSLKATLGALNITDNFFFAVPFGTDLWCFLNGENFIECQNAYTVISPNLLFVKKRVEASISLAGITLTNLAEFGDVTFPHDTYFGYGLYTPYGPLPCAELSTDGRCPTLPDQLDYPNGYTQVDQHFAFGDVLTIEGQTVSGITVRNVTGICMDPQFYEGYKKISFVGALNPECAAHVEASAEGDQFDTVLATSLHEDKAMPSPIQVVTPFVVSLNPKTVVPDGQIEVSLVSSSCTDNGDKTSTCSKILQITNLIGHAPVTFHFSVVGSSWSVGNSLRVGCENSTTPWTSGSDSVTLPPGTGGLSITNCGWTATFAQGVHVDTHIVATVDLLKPPLMFDVEKIQLEGVPIGPITANFYGEFRPSGIGFPFSLKTDLSFNTPIGAVTAELQTQDITQQFLNGALLTLSSGGVTIAQEWNASLAPFMTTATLGTTLNPDSNPASLKIRARICQAVGSSFFTRFSCLTTGLRRLETTLSLKRSGVNLTVYMRMSGGPPVSLSILDFTMGATAGAVNLGADVELDFAPTYAPAWIGVFNAGINF